MLKDKYLTSIANYLYRSGCKVCSLKAIFHNMPEQFKVPAIYYPNPTVTSNNDTLSSFLLTYSWFVKIFAASTEDAYEIAAQIQRDLCGDRFSIPIKNDDGSMDGNRHIRIKRLEIKQIDDSVYQVYLLWEERVQYNDIGLNDGTQISNVSVELNANGSVREILTDDNGRTLTDDEGNILFM